MSDSIERPKSYEEGYRDGFIAGQEESRKMIEHLIQGDSKPVVCNVTESEAIRLYKGLIAKMRCCENCKFVGEDMYSRRVCTLYKESPYAICHNYNRWELNLDVN